MNKETGIINIGHIRLIIESDFSDDKGKIHYNEPEQLLYTTAFDDEIKSIVLEDKNYYELVARVIEQFYESYKEKHL